MRIRTLAKALALLASLIFAPTSLGAVSCPTIALDVKQDLIPEVDALCVLEDVNHVVGPEHILSKNLDDQFTVTSSRNLHFSHTDSVYWIHFRLHNTENKQVTWYLQVSYPPLDELMFIEVKNGELDYVQTGDRWRFLSRPIEFKNYIFPIELAADGETAIYLKVRSQGAINIPLSLHRPDQLLTQASNASTLQGALFGVMGFMALFNALMFATTRTSGYFYNAFYMIGTGGFLAAMNGMAFQYLWPESPELANLSVPFAEALGCASMLLFGRSFLEIGKEHRRLLPVLNTLAAIAIANLLVAIYAPYAYSIKWITAISLVSIITLYITGIVRLRQGYSPALHYLLSWTIMALGTLIYALAAFGYAPNYLATEIVMEFSLGFQILLLNYALVNRFRLMNTRMLAMESEAKAELENQVRIRTEELKQTMYSLEDANRRLAEMNSRDELTGVFNRRYFDRWLTHELQVSRRKGVPLTVLLIDADHFKRVNDVYGHLAGDDCLRQLAVSLRYCIRRPEDVLARYGGEEFAAILPDTPADGAIHIAESILNSVRKRTIDADGHPLKITVSIGIAVFAPGDTEQETDVVRRADMALYAAKQQGRDRLIVADAPPSRSA